MTLFRLDASIRTDGSVSRQIADTVEKAWRSDHADGRVVYRDLAAQPLLPGACKLAITAGFVQPGERTAEQAAAVTYAAEMADELLAADAYLFAVPLYNLGVPYYFKEWIDLLIADQRFGPGKRPLTGRPGVVVVTRGGGYGPGTPMEGWDHATPWLRHALGGMFGIELEVVEAELTMAKVNPAMSDLIELSVQQLEAAHVAAEGHGRTLAERVGS